MQTRLSEAEKQQLKKAAISTETAKSQTDGSSLFILLSTDSISSPMRLADNHAFKNTPLSEFFDMSQTIDGKPAGEDGIFVKYIKEIISYKIDKNEITTPEQAKVEINKIYSAFHSHMSKKQGDNPAALVSEKQKSLEGDIIKIQEQRNAELVNVNKSITDIKSAIDQVKKANRSFFTPTGLKAMQAEIKKFDRMPNPTYQDKLDFLANIKNIAESRISNKNDSRGAILQDFYIKVANFEPDKNNQIASKDIQLSKVTTLSLVRIKDLFKDNSGPESTFGKIDSIISQGISSGAKLEDIKILLETRLADRSPERQLKTEYTNIYKALINYVEESKNGKLPDMNAPKYTALDKLIKEKHQAAILSAVGMDAGTPAKLDSSTRRKM